MYLFKLVFSLSSDEYSSSSVSMALLSAIVFLDHGLVTRMWRMPLSPVQPHCRCYPPVSPLSSCLVTRSAMLLVSRSPRPTCHTHKTLMALLVTCSILLLVMAVNHFPCLLPTAEQIRGSMSCNKKFCEILQNCISRTCRMLYYIGCS